MMLVSAPAAAEEVRWVGDQTGPFGIDKQASGWSFFEGTMWSGFRPPGFIYDGGLQPAPGDIAIFDAQQNASAPDPQPYNMGLGATVYFGDFAGRQNNSIQPILYYEAQDVVNEQLIVRSGEWTFDLGPGHHGAGAVPGPDHGSYTLTDRIVVGGGEVTLNLTNGEVNSNYVAIGSGTDIPAFPNLAELNVVDATLITNAMGLFDVGIQGTNGALVVTGESLVQTGYMRVGENAGSIGRVRLSGSNAHADVNGMQIGATGSGRLEILSGSSLHSINQVALANFGNSGQGTVLVSGIESALSIDTGFIVGDTGLGILDITSGGTVSSLGVVVGNHTTATGEVTVNGGPFADDNLSKWQANQMVIGNDGHGDVLVTNRGEIVSETALIGNTTNGVGTVVVQGGGSSWTSTDEVNIGLEGRGSLRIEDGADVVGTYFSALGRAVTGVGEAVVTGSGSTWTTTVLVGELGEGHLTIEDGGKVFTRGGSIGSLPGANGDVMVTGEGSELAADSPGADDFHVGVSGDGSLLISGGASFSHHHGNTFIARGLGGHGVVTVTGENSSWTSDTLIMSAGDPTIGGSGDAHSSLIVEDNATLNVSFGVAVAESGIADVTIQSGAKLQSGSAVIGFFSGSEGQATVTGDGSSWRADFFDVGAAGHGELVVSNLAAVEVANTLRLGSDGTVDVEDMGTINVGDGNLPNPNTLRVGPNGTLAGTGTIIGDVVVDGGTVSPGASPGTLHITGNYHQLPGGLLTMEIGGTAPGTQYDQLLVTGNLLLEGAVNVAFINGFRPRVGQAFDLFGGGTFQLTGPLNFVNAPPAFQYVFNVDGGVFSVTVTAVPEPASMALAAAIVPLLCVRRRRPAEAARQNQYATQQHPDRRGFGHGR
jgi:T5SS/PEP-CTERM-associated repeat protein